MIDAAYLAGTALFFALMLGFVRACERLGRASTTETPHPEEAHR